MGCRHVDEEGEMVASQRFILSDLVAVILHTIRNLFGALANGFDAGSDLAKAHSNAVADEREFISETRSDIRSIIEGN